MAREGGGRWEDSFNEQINTVKMVLVSARTSQELLERNAMITDGEYGAEKTDVDECQTELSVAPGNPASDLFSNDGRGSALQEKTPG